MTLAPARGRSSEEDLPGAGRQMHACGTFLHPRERLVPCRRPEPCRLHWLSAEGIIDVLATRQASRQVRVRPSWRVHRLRQDDMSANRSARIGAKRCDWPVGCDRYRCTERDMTPWGMEGAAICGVTGACDRRQRTLPGRAREALVSGKNWGVCRRGQGEGGRRLDRLHHLAMACSRPAAPVPPSGRKGRQIPPQ